MCSPCQAAHSAVAGICAYNKGQALQGAHQPPWGLGQDTNQKDHDGWLNNGVLGLAFTHLERMGQSIHSKSYSQQAMEKDKLKKNNKIKICS